MSATAAAAMFYGLGLIAVAAIVLVTHMSSHQTLKALATAMEALTKAIERMTK